jgi:hypothetical protein
VNIPNLDECFDLWNKDGFFRDIYLFETNVEDWQKFLEFNKNRRIKYSQDGQEKDIPSACDLLNNRDVSHLMLVDLAGIKICTNFICIEEIELYVDPLDITGDTQHVAVLTYVAQLAKALNRTAYITPESTQNNPILTFDPSKDNWTFHRSQ